MKVDDFILLRKLACFLIIAPFLLVTKTLPDPELPSVIKEEVKVVENTVSLIEEEAIPIKEEPISIKKEAISNTTKTSRTNSVSRSGINRENSIIEGKEEVLDDFGFPLHIEYIVSSNYGYRGKEFHTGVDMAVPLGTEIYAPYDGIVIELQSKNTGYGNLIIIEHEGGVFTYYAHLSAFEVELEDTVSKDELIGYVGSTGRSTGPHLHYEIRIDEKTINPLKTRM